MSNSNPFSNARREAKRFSDNYAMDMATVVEAPDNTGHLIKIRMLEPEGLSDPEGAIVLVNEHGDINIPSVGDYVLVGYTRGRVPFVVGTLYKGADNIPSYRACERIIGHANSTSEIRFNCDGSIDLDTSVFTINATTFNIEGDTTNINTTTTNINSTDVTIAGDTVTIDGTTIEIPGFEGGGTTIGGGGSGLNFKVIDESAGRGVQVVNDGNILYTAQSDTGLPESTMRLYRYDLSKPYDINTETLVGSVELPGTENSLSFHVHENGSKVFVTGDSGTQEFTFGTAYDINTLTQTNSHAANHSDIFVSPDESKMLFAENGDFYEYTVSTPGDISTATQTQTYPVYWGSYFAVSDDGEVIYDIHPDGEAAIAIRHELETPYSLSNVNETEAVVLGTWKPNGGDYARSENKLFVGGYIIGQYNTGADGSTGGGEGGSIGEEIQWKDSKKFGFGAAGFDFANGGRKVYTTDRDQIYEYNLSEPYEIQTASLVNSFAGWPNVPEDVVVKEDGTRLVYVDSSNDSLYQYDFGTPYDITTLSAAGSISIGEPSPTGLDVTDGGTRVYITSFAKLEQYTLNTAWDITSLGSVENELVPEDNRGYISGSTRFKSDGTEFYSANSEFFSNSGVSKWKMSTPWDISTATLDQTTPLAQLRIVDGVAATDDGSRIWASDFTWTELTVETNRDKFGIGGAGTIQDGLQKTENAMLTDFMDSAYLSPNGEHLYTGTTGHDIDHYTLSEPYNLKTATLTTTITDISPNLHSITFKPDGSKMYISDYNFARQYTLSTPWDITTRTQDVEITDAADNHLFELEGMTFSDDGNFLYGLVNGWLVKISCATPWDITNTTAEQFAAIPIDWSYWQSPFQDIHVTNDGQYLYSFFEQKRSDTVMKYRMTTPHDLSTLIIDTMYNPIVHGGSSIQVIDGRIWIGDYYGIYYELTQDSTSSTTSSGAGATVSDNRGATSPAEVTKISTRYHENIGEDIRQIVTSPDGNYVFLRILNDGFRVLDISDPSDMRVVWSTTDRTDLLAQFGKYLYAFDTFNIETKVWDISKPDSPKLVNTVADSVPDNAQYYETHSSGYIYVPYTDVEVIDVTNPTVPTFSTYTDNLTDCESVAINSAEDRLVITYSIDGVYELIDISTPSTPTTINTYNSPETFVQRNISFLDGTDILVAPDADDILFYNTAGDTWTYIGGLFNVGRSFVQTENMLHIFNFAIDEPTAISYGIEQFKLTANTSDYYYMPDSAYTVWYDILMGEPTVEYINGRELIFIADINGNIFTLY